MKAELKEYNEAMEENLKANRDELVAKEVKRKAAARLFYARQALFNKEHDLLEDAELNRIPA